MADILDTQKHRDFQMIAWNVNGYSKIIHECIKQLIVDRDPDVIFLSETRRSQEEVEKLLSELNDYAYIINSHNPDWYHGVAMLIHKRNVFEELKINLGIPRRKDTNEGTAETGRLIGVKIQQHIIIGTYTPNAGKELKHIAYRVVAWDLAMTKLLNDCREMMPTILIGDINVAPEDIDISHSSMLGFPGATKCERDNHRAFLDDGWVDIYRQQNPQKRIYTWRGDHSIPIYGMRLDNILISPDLLDRMGEAFVIEGYTESDHVPVGCYMQMI